MMRSSSIKRLRRGVLGELMQGKIQLRKAPELPQTTEEGLLGIDGGVTPGAYVWYDANEGEVRPSVRARRGSAGSAAPACAGGCAQLLTFAHLAATRVL